MIVERASVTFEGLSLSAERARAITERALALAARSRPHREGEISGVVLGPVVVDDRIVDDEALARRIAGAIARELAAAEGGR